MMFASKRDFWRDASRRVGNFMDALRIELEEREYLEKRSHKQRVRDLLLRNVNQWVSRPYRRCPAMWHSRVAELRREGHRIDCRQVVNPNNPKDRDYQYMLVVTEETHDELRSVRTADSPETVGVGS